MNVNPDDLLKMIGVKEVELQIARQEIAVLRNTIQKTEAEVLRLRELIPPTPAPEG